ncbi:MAG: DUF3772 domain-containing protein [Pseudomonadota bacterium]
MRVLRVYLWVALLGALGAVLVAPHAAAQEQDGALSASDYLAWEALADRAEAVVARAVATNAVLENLREQVAEWRERFIAAEGTNAARIAILREQITALGAPPGEGESESEAIASRRADLNTQLSDAMAPVRRANEALRLAEGLIRQIDTLIRARQADEMLRREPAPINPVLYPPAATNISDSVTSLIAETTARWQSDALRDALQQNLLQIAVYLAIALILLLRGRQTMEQLTLLVIERFSGRAVRLAAFFTSLFQVLVPLFGIFLLVQAVQLTGLLGFRGERLVGVLPLMGAAIFGARWLANRLQPIHDDGMGVLPIPSDRPVKMRLQITWLGTLIAILLLLNAFARVQSLAPETQAVLYFPVFVLIGLTHFRIGKIIMRVAGEAIAAAETATFALRVQRIVGRALLLVGVAAPFVAAIGYKNLAYFLAMPTSLTLAVLALLRVLHDIVMELYALLTGKTIDEAREALTPSLISFVLVLASVPLLALIWGARVADLTEILAQVREGFAIGETVISPGAFLVFAVIFAVLYAGTRLFQSALKSSILPKTQFDQGAQTALVSGVGYVGIGLAAIIAVTTAGIDLSGLALVAGALSVGIGFGLQNIVSNFISGIILLVERPVAEGDWIEVGGHMGIVKDISVRSTRIETFDKNDVIVPNADFISGAVKNWTRGNVTGRIIVVVGVAYGSDTRRVAEILLEIAMDHPLVSLNPEPAVDFLDFGASSLDFQIRMILPDIGQGMAVRTEIRHQITERFAAEGIEIPFPQSDVWLRNPETLRPERVSPEPLSSETVVSGPGTEHEHEHEHEAGQPVVDTAMHANANERTRSE